MRSTLPLLTKVSLGALLLIAAAVAVHYPKKQPEVAAVSREEEQAKAPSMNSAPMSDFATVGIDFLQKHCLKCHGEKDPKADLALHTYRDDTSVVKERKVWENVLQMVQSGEMPPKPRPRPEAEELEAFVKSVNGIFDRADRNAKPDPGRVAVRRLNRAEYNNTIRDLVGVDFNPAEDFPADDSGHGFDNSGEALTLSPLLLERYLDAAESIVQRAILVGEPPKPPVRQLPGVLLQPPPKSGYRKPFRSLDAQGDLSTVHELTVAGEYKVRARVWGCQVGDEPVKIAMTVGDKEVHSAEVKATGLEQSKYIVSPPVPLEPGKHRVAVSFLNPFTDPKAKPDEARRELFLLFLELEGPMDMVPLSHKRLLACTPGKPQAEQTREILTRFASRAYRRPATADEVGRLVKLVEACATRGDKWEAALQLAFKAVLCSPKFLFRIELDDRPDADGPHPIDEYQLASRLSYFLWSTMPDDELFDLAAKKQLTANLEAQVRRMLKDPKAQALTENFALQWLALRQLRTVAPDAKLFPTFNDHVRAAMLKETELFFGEIVRDDRSILDLIDGDFTYLNEPLARHYGIVDTQGNRVGQKTTQPGGMPIRGHQFVRVQLQGDERGGLLTQASVLTVTSNPTRTSPVKRGRWVLDHLLGTPPPPPPPDVPELEEAKRELTGSLRQRMEKHRTNPSCASCHARMDPIGFAFENYDAIGRFRTKDGDADIDPSGTLPDGSSFNGPRELKGILKTKKERFTRNLTEKMLTYALGRGLERYDRPTVERISRALDRSDYKFSTLVIEIVKSDPFRLRRGKEQP